MLRLLTTVFSSSLSLFNDSLQSLKYMQLQLLFLFFQKQADNQIYCELALSVPFQIVASSHTLL